MTWWNDYIRVPFAEKGRDRKGCDCWGLLRLIYMEQLGCLLPDYLEYYEKTTDRDDIATAIRELRQARWLEVEQPQEFDAILMREGGYAMHVGVVTKKNHMIHCQRDIGTQHVPFNDSTSRNRVVGFFRYEQ